VLVPSVYSIIIRLVFIMIIESWECTLVGHDIQHRYYTA
jgi:hypothetical protein